MLGGERHSCQPTKQVTQEFVKEYFDQNPISQLVSE